ncbi:histidine phosphatase family protein [Pseudonocardia eucalypti]|uniref:Histidine phosphatase family protein n=1 Tax=Pseudonocardia eucalypti TaxID=648755 RepID=A0ABP9QKZ7_9PSEU|nr:phosphohistidine phosphatase [Pseudonocardia eucalypti]
MRRRLILLRHAKSDWTHQLPDHDRPLAGRGRREAPLAGRWLSTHTPDIDLVVCSTAERAQRTWRLVAKELAAPPEVRLEEHLYGASVADLLKVARALPDEAGTALFVGHNPGLEEFVVELTRIYYPMKTSSIAVISWAGGWTDAAPGEALLDAVETPRP